MLLHEDGMDPESWFISTNLPYITDLVITGKRHVPAHKQCTVALKLDAGSGGLLQLIETASIPNNAHRIACCFNSVAGD
jgi:hypothetical protein